MMRDIFGGKFVTPKSSPANKQRRQDIDAYYELLDGRHLANSLSATVDDALRLGDLTDDEIKELRRSKHAIKSCLIVLDDLHIRDRFIIARALLAACLVGQYGEPLKEEQAERISSSISSITARSSIIDAYKKEKGKRQGAIMRKARAPARDKASAVAEESIERHANAELRRSDQKYSPRALARKIEPNVAADMEAAECKPLKDSAIAGRIRKNGGVSYYKS